MRKIGDQCTWWNRRIRQSVHEVSAPTTLVRSAFDATGMRVISEPVDSRGPDRSYVVLLHRELHRQYRSMMIDDQQRRGEAEAAVRRMQILSSRYHRRIVALRPRAVPNSAPSFRIPLYGRPEQDSAKDKGTTNSLQVSHI